MLRGIDLIRKVHSTVVASARGLINTAFNKHLFITNVTISFSLSGLGDILQQQHNMLMRQQQTWDTARTRHMTCSGITVGALCHHWYILLDRKLPGRTINVVLKKLLVDQLLFSPFALLYSFSHWASSRVGTGVTSCPVCQTRDGGCMWQWLVWPPAQIINFYLLPTKFRVLYDNTVSLLFDVYTSHVCYDVKFSEDKEEECEEALEDSSRINDQQNAVLVTNDNTTHDRIEKQCSSA